VIKNKRILITGGSGFIGSHLCNKLIKYNKIVCVDNLISGKKQNIKKIFKDKNFTFIKHDIKKYLNIKVDYIFHLACPASPIQYQKNPIDTMLTNILGTYNILRLAKKYKSTVLFTSTSEVYGDPLINPQKETYLGNVNSIGIRACYDEGKRSAETICYDFIRKYNLNIKIVRIFNTYGPYMDINDGRVVSNFIVNAIKNKNIEIYGKGKQTRSLCYIEDLVEGLIKISKLPKNFHGPINLGNNNEISIKDLALKVLKLTNSKSKLTYRTLPLDDPKRRVPELKLAKNKINWKPKTNLQNGLKHTINYFKMLRK
tara:strand:+ start:580 stop:1521 length:942 start_codon:yes stop_codon:yes gene_type:complete